MRLFIIYLTIPLSSPFHLPSIPLHRVSTFVFTRVTCRKSRNRARHGRDHRHDRYIRPFNRFKSIIERGWRKQTRGQRGIRVFAPAKRKQPAGLTKRDYIINESFNGVEKKLERFFRKQTKFHGVGTNSRDNDGHKI